MIDRKNEENQAHFAAMIGERIIQYEAAELLLGDGTWDSWSDLPIRLDTESNKLVEISWSRLDDLWLADGFSLPFPVEGSTIRGAINSLEEFNPAVGASIESVILGQGEMSIEGESVEIWTFLRGKSWRCGSHSR